MKKIPSSKLTRRQFLLTTGAAIALPLIVPGCAVGQSQSSKRARPSNRINLGIVGWGLQGPGNTKSFLAEDDCRVIAACDLDKDHLAAAVDTINGHYQNKDCAAYHSFSEMIARDDIDAVMIAVPDQWHALLAIEAAKQGKDIYCEKPLAKTVHEQQAIVRAVQKAGVIWQTGSWQRSQATFRKAAEIVRNGLIGKVSHVEVGLPSGHHDFAQDAPELLKKLDGVKSLAEVVPGTPQWDIAVTEPPATLDYQTWIGPSTMQPYIKQRVHMNWRWNYNTGGGQLLDWVGHHLDIAHWGLDFDRSGPSELEGHGDFPAANAIWNTATKYRVEMKYPQDITIVMAGGYPEIKSGVKWIGSEGWVWVDREGFEGSNPDWKKTKNLPEEFRKIKLYETKGHQRNFLDCIKSRQLAIAPVETAHHSAVPGHLGLISMLTGRKIRWSVEHEKIIGDAQASKLLTRGYRAPYKLG
jgi:predicted dehydrogenase